MKYYTCLLTTIILITVYFLTIAVTTEIPEEIDIDSIKEPLAESVTLSEIKGGIPVEEVKEIVKEVEVDEHELYLLSHILHGECGSDACPDEMQIATGSVLLNRVKSEYFPNTMEECVFQKGQYSCTREGGGFWKEPTERTVENARYLLINGSQLPDNVLFQSQYIQSDGVYMKIGNQYYCYKED